MRKVAAFGIATAILLMAASDSRADTCETFAGSQIYTDQCGPGSATQQPSQPKAAPVHTRDNELRDKLRRMLSKGAPPPSPAIDDAQQRWADAQARAQDATYRAQQTDDPAQKAQLKQQYETAMHDLHQAGVDLVKADPQQKSKIQALLKAYDTEGAKAAAAAGLEAPPKAAVAEAPAKPAAPDNVAQIGGDTYVCDAPVAGGINISCRQISADGKQCANAMLADGDVSWQDSIATPCRASDLAQRKTFLARDPDAAAAVANAPPAFTADPGATRNEIDRLTRPDLTAALDDMPKECRADFEKFLASGEGKSKANAAQAAASYAKLDKKPECRDAMKRVATALSVALPHRKMAAGDRSDWSAAMAGPQRASIQDVPDIDISNIADTGFDPGDSLDSAIDMLNALSGGLGALSGSMRSMPSYRPAPAYRAPAPTYRPAPQPSYTYTPGRNSGSNSDITGTH